MRLGRHSIIGSLGVVDDFGHHQTQWYGSLIINFGIEKLKMADISQILKPTLKPKLSKECVYTTVRLTDKLTKKKKHETIKHEKQ